MKVVRRLPHPGRGFTQGLLAGPDDSVLESTGLYGQSQLRRYRLGSDSYQASATLSEDFFGEGICQVGDSIWQLTWRERTALRWDAATLELRDLVSYSREGWGICGDAAGGDLVTSDGTSELVRRDPDTLQPREVIKVRCQGERVQGLNDLAWSAGRVWANVAPTSAIVGIDPGTGDVTDLVDASAAAEPRMVDPQAIMNGIAALPRSAEVAGVTGVAGVGGSGASPGADPGDFLLTGKGWRWLREVRLVPARGRTEPRRLLEGAGRFFF
ncbi:MAG: glutamine cyclotransferase [Actinomycetia bacterium]|nr:glutamine cyclotransferase [Actinomycetes bacterium]